ncbi:CLUMA_CG019124, isoform A [Clunio marinus]|uniref:CLUMA_CG019124, isoform A n=1 Tax=Clunio marinus TaxID=568069 RepID=A0A1J1J4B0_9DIPT|nr:CLUMA_CG019124, isoform A [Clunio marinus]
MNVTETSITKADDWPWTKIVLIVLFCLLIVITIIGNTLVILSVITTRRLRTVTNLFVTSLAVAGSWHLGWVLCEFWISLDVLLCTASILSLCAISIDRYLAVTQPLNYSKRRRSKRLAMVMILIVWILALAITCPPILGWHDVERRRADIKDCEYNKDKGYVIYSASGSFFIPMSIMLYVYSKIFCVLSSRQSRISRTEACERSTDIEAEFVTSEMDSSYPQSSKDVVINNTLREPQQTTLYELLEYAKSRSILKGNSQNATNNSNHGSFVIRSFNTVQFNQHHHSMNENSSIKSNKKMPIRISSLKRETKTAQTLSIVVKKCVFYSLPENSFIACWLPFFIHYISKPFMEKDSVWTNKVLEDCLIWLGWINSAINPFIYAFYNGDFRIAFYRLTFRACCRNQQNTVFK